MTQTPAPADMKHAPRQPLVVDNRWWFFTAVFLSMLLHAVIAYAVHDRNLLRFNTQAAAPIEQTYQVRRAQPQLGVRPKRHGEGPAADTASVDEIDLSAVSQALLIDDLRLGREAGERPAAVIDRPTEEREDDPGQSPQVVMPDAALQERVVEELVGRLFLQVAYVKEDVSGVGDGGLVDGADGGPDSSDGPGTQADQQTAAMLKAAGVRPTTLPPPGNMPPPPITRPAATERVRQTDRTLAEPIDFTEMALEAVTSLKLPKLLDSDFEYQLQVFKPKKRGLFGSDELPGAYFKVDVTGRKSLRKLKAMHKDIILLVDTSGSVSPAWVKQTIRGLQDALASLNKGDRFNIVFFKDETFLFSEEPFVDRTPRNLTEARQFLSQATSGGFTDVNQAMHRFLLRDVADDRVYELVLISDGRSTRGVTETRALINLITKDNDRTASIYCIGIGDKQDRDVLQFLAYQNKGYCVFAEKSPRAAPVIRKLISNLRYPLITDVQLTVAGMAAGDVVPVNIPNIHQGGRFSIFGRFTELSRFTVRISGKNHGKDVAFTFTRDLSQARPGQSRIMQDWALWRLHHLASERIRGGDEDGGILKQMERLATRYKLPMVK